MLMSDGRQVNIWLDELPARSLPVHPTQLYEASRQDFSEASIEVLLILFGSGMLENASSSGPRMWSVTGPQTSNTSAWRGVGVKAGTPPEVVKILRDAFQESMSHKIYHNYLADNSMGPESVLNGEDWDAFLDAKWPIWQTAMKELGYVGK